MKRITPEEVIDAYIATGMYPCFGHMGNGSGGVCALSALALSKDKSFDIYGAQQPEWLKLLDVSALYFWNFVDGFDGNNEHQYGLKVGGHSDGQAARAAVLEHFAHIKQFAHIEQPVLVS